MASDVRYYCFNESPIQTYEAPADADIIQDTPHCADARPYFVWRSSRLINSFLTCSSILNLKPERPEPRRDVARRFFAGVATEAIRYTSVL